MTSSPESPRPVQPSPGGDAERTIAHPEALISPEEAIEREKAGALLIDVRSPQGQAANGLLDGAVSVAKSEASEVLDPASDSRLPALNGSLDQPIVVTCGTEFGSDPIVDQLITFGYTNIAQIEGGVLRWVEEGRPTTPVAEG